MVDEHWLLVWRRLTLTKVLLSVAAEDYGLIDTAAKIDHTNNTQVRPACLGARVLWGRLGCLTLNERVHPLFALCSTLPHAV